MGFPAPAANDRKMARGLSTYMALVISAALLSIVTPISAANCAGRGTYNPTDGSCTCDVGYGGDDCSINLLELSSVSNSRRKLESAQSHDDWPTAPQPAGGDDLVDPPSLGAADLSGSVPFNLRNMLLYADTLVNSKTEAAAVAGAGRHLLNSGSVVDGQTVGCGFYDIFYEGCGTMSQCFYNSLNCSPDPPFYDFYTGAMLRHSPETEYFDDFLAGSVFGDRGFLSKPSVTWSSTTPAVTDAGDDYNGGLAAGTPLSLQLGALPNAPHEIMMSFDFVVDGSLGPFDRSPVKITVLGEGTVEASAVLDVSRTTDGQSIHQVEFRFTYSGSNLKLKISTAAPLTGTWGVDKVMVSSIVTNYPPVAEDKQMHISPDPLVSGDNTIELRGFDEECEDLEYHVTSLPTEGRLYHCACDSLWTTPITPADLPALVPAPCYRLVYEPAANEPKVDLAGNPFDAFQYRTKDAYGEYSKPAYVKVFIDSPDTEDTPVAGSPGLAIACDGADDIVSVSWALGELTEEFTLEMRFKVTGDGAGTLLAKSGSYWLGWTEFGALGAMVMTTSGAELRVEALLGYTDRLWHHVAVMYDGTMLGLAVDGELVSSVEGGAGSPAAADPTSYTTLCAQLVPGTSTVAAQTAFNGHIDDVRFWSIALGMNKVTELWVGGYIADPDSEEGLRAYFDFNLGGNVPVSSAVFDRTSAHIDAFFSTLSEAGVSAGLSAMFPVYVSSTAVHSGIVSTIEDTPVLINLHGGDLEGGVTFWASTLPLKGDLVDVVTGRTIITSFAPITGNTVMYHPKGSANGRDVFKYQAFDGSEFSYRSGVLIDITPVNDPPVCAALTTVVPISNSPTLIQLTGSDVDDGAFLRYVITRPPRRGQLYQSDLLGNKEELIDASMTSVGSASAFVVYQPRDAGTDASEGYPYDSFAYLVYDIHSNSNECVVDISIPDIGCDPLPVSGDPGYALRFDGEDDFVALGSLSMLLPDWPMRPEMSLGLWFRTSYVTTEGRITIAQIGPFSLHLSKVYGLGLGLGSRMAPTFEPFNDGSWYRVVVTFDGANVHLYANGALKASLMDVELPTSFDDGLILGYWSAGAEASGRTGHYNGQIDEVSLWSSVVDGVGENTAVAPNFAGYDRNQPSYPASVVAHWALNEAQGVTIYNGASRQWTEALGAAGQAETQPRWVASTVPIGDVYHAREGELEVLSLTCSSEFTDSVDAALLTIPGMGGVGGGRLWYTEDGVTPLYPIIEAPHVVKEGKVIYESGNTGSSADFLPNYGNFAYVCIGDLQRTLADHLSDFDFYGLSAGGSAAQRSINTFMDAVSDIIKNLPTPPPIPPPACPVMPCFQPLTPVPPPIAPSLSSLSFYGLALSPLSPTDNDTVVLPPSPIPIEPPTVEDLATVVLKDLIDQLFPTGTAGPDGAAGTSQISAVNMRIVLLEITPSAFIDPSNAALLSDLVILLAGSAGVDPASQVHVEAVEQNSVSSPAQRVIQSAPEPILPPDTGNIIIFVRISFRASEQASAHAFADLIKGNSNAVFTQLAPSSGVPFIQRYGTTDVTAFSVEALNTAVAAGVGPSCFQVSNFTVVEVNVQHVNHAPTACAPSGDCRLSIAYGAHSDLTYEINATDIDNDNLEVYITYLASKGTLLAPYGAVDTAPAESPVRGDLLSLYISREGARVARDPNTDLFPVVYSPQVNGAGAGFDAFGFVVSDGTTLSKEYTVHVDVADNALFAPLPTAGTNGYAIAFDGDDDHATLGPLEPYGLDSAATFALWLKTGSSGYENGMTLLSAGPYRLYWSKLGGLSFSYGPAHVASGMALNDLSWHHVAAAYDGVFIMLYIDGQPVDAARVAPSLPERIPMMMQRSGHMANHTASITLGAWEDDGHLMEYFSGQLDEVAIFNTASAELMVGIAARRRCGAAHLSCFEGDEEGLAGYWRMNEALGPYLASEVPPPTGVTPEAMRLGSADGTAAAMPMRVASTVPLLNTIELLEDTDVNFTLPGVTFDMEDPTVVISFLPATGHLFVAGARLAAGASFPMSSTVTYVPKNNEAGTEAFGYIVHDGTMASDVQVVQLVVHPQNDVPEAADIMLAVDFKDPSPVEIRLKARDVDEGDVPMWLITVLPSHGTLYTSSPAFSAGSFETPSRNQSGLITAPNTVVSSRVWYMPMINDDGMTDSFSYVVEDAATVAQQELLLDRIVSRESAGDDYNTALRPFGSAAARRLRSRMATVTLDGSAVGLPAQDTPVVGIAGLALHFDGYQTLAVLGNASEYGLMFPSSAAPATMSAWFKTSAVTVEDRMSLIVAGPFSLTWTKILGLQFSVGSTTLPSYSAWNDGAWHHVVATYDGNTMGLSIGGAAPVTMAAPWDPAWPDAPVMLGADSLLASYYNGFLDELVMGSSAVGLFHMNEASSSLLINAGTGPPGFLGTNGVAATQPSRVASSAPLSLGPITLEEDTEEVVTLVAHNTDAAATGVNFVITELPTRGRLYTTSAISSAKGTLIRDAHLPKMLATGVDKVVFVPDANNHSSADIPYARFAYAAVIADVAVTAARSASMSRTFYVLPVNDTPKLAARFHTLNITESKVGEVSLAAAGASDVETPSADLTTMVTFLPAIGLLYQWDNTLITERNSVVTDAELRLKYVPPPNLAASPLTAFGFVVSDGELHSEAGVVTVSVTGNSALDLSFGGSVFVAADTMGGAPPQLDGAFTVDAWVHIPAGGLAASVWSVVSTSFASLPSSAGEFTTPRWPAALTFVNEAPAFEEGRWHHLAWVSKLDGPEHTAALLYVDGVLIALQAVVREGSSADPADPSSLVIGAPQDGTEPAAFLGKVDEVRVYSRGLMQCEVIASMNARTRSALSSPTGNEAVGKGLELYLHPDLASDLVAHWTFDSATAAGLTPNALAGRLPGQLTGGAKLAKVHAPMAPTSAAAQAVVPGLRASTGSGYALLMDCEDDAVSASLNSTTLDNAAGGAMELWFKSGNSQPFMALASLGALSAHWTQQGGLGLHIAGVGSLHTFSSFADGAWHHVKAVAAFIPSARNFPDVGPGHWNLTLTVDNMTYGPMAVTATAPLFGQAASLMIGSSSDAGWTAMGAQRFCGTLDFASATSANSSTVLALPAFDGPMSRAGLMRDLSGNDVEGVLEGGPLWVFSSAPRAVPTYTIQEDAGLTPIALLAADAEGDELKFFVTAAPAHGMLYTMDANGTLLEVEICPAGGDAHDDEGHCTPVLAPMDGGAPVVHYRPAANEYGTVLLQYVADDGYMRSDPAHIVIDIEPVNDLPGLVTSRVMLGLGNGTPDAVVTLGEGEDVEGEDLAYVISTLPVRGRLYQYGTDGARISVPGTAVLDAGRRVVYRPGMNAVGATYDTFGFQATDGNVGACIGAPPIPCPPQGDAMPYYTAEGIVTVGVGGDALVNSIPVAGHAGYALEFDGVDDMVAVAMDDSVGGPVTIELWLKSSNAVNEFAAIATLVAPGAEPDYVSVHLTRFGAVGVDASVGGEVRAVYSHATVNDGNWHHVAASFDGGDLVLLVDGVGCDVCASEHPAGTEAMPAFASLSLGPASSAAYSLLFAGLVDDVRLWNVVRNAGQVASSMHVLLHGDEPGLRIWYPLDGQSTLDGVVRDDAFGDGAVEDGEARGDIRWVPSSAPTTTLKYTVDEDSRTGVELYGTDADFDALTFYILGLPEEGTLYPSDDVDAAPITATPFLLPGSRVWYQPPPHAFGGPAFDEFGYGVHDGMTFSAEARLLIDDVLPTPDTPFMHSMPANPYTVATGGSLMITAHATDYDLINAGSGDLVELLVSVLPSTGALYQVASDGMSLGERITAPGTPLTATSLSGFVITGRLMFVPDMDLGRGGYTGANGERQPYNVTFGLQVADTNSAYSYGSSEAIVHVTITPAPVMSAAPVDVTAPLGLGAAGFRGGLTGQAILLDGESGHVVGDNSTSGSNMAALDGSFTVELFFKSTAAMQEKTVLLAKEGGFSLGWRRYFGLSATVTTSSGSSVMVGSRARYNDGWWHHVALVWSGPEGTLSLFVDSVLVDSTPDEEGGSLPLSSSGPLVIGSDGSGTQAVLFAGFVDELRMWAGAMDAAGVLNTYSGMPNGDETVPLALHYTFNLQMPPTTAVVDASGQDRNATFVDAEGASPVYLTSSTPVYMKAVVVPQDTAKLIRLVGGDIDLDAVDFRITTLPGHGQLLVDGEPIHAVPYRLPARELVFMPAPGSHDDTTFTFIVSDGKMFSGVATVVLQMGGTPDAPTALPIPPISSFTDVCGRVVGNNRGDAPELGGVPAPWWYEACEAGQVALYMVTLQGYDWDNDAITFHVTTLPQLGRLFQANLTDPTRPDLLSPVTAPGAMVIAQDGRNATLWYSLQDMDYLSKPQEVMFGYAVTEASGSYLTSVEQKVGVMLTQHPDAPTVYSGVKGFALYLDGSDASVESPVEASSVGDFSLETWFKSSGALLESATLLSAPTFRLGWTRYAGLGMHFFGISTDIHSGMALNDGEWHHVAVSVVRAGATVLYVDGAAVATAPFTPALDIDEILTLTIGRSAMPQSARVRSQFRGQMDEVRLWTRALSADDVAERMNLMLMGDEPSLAAYLRFNRGDIVRNLTVRDLAGTANRSAVVEGSPVLVSSDAPLVMLASMPENERVTLSLTGGDAPTGSMLHAMITGLPAHGRLIQIDSMQPITAVPTLVADPLNRVMFEPEPHTHGDASAVPTYRYGSVKFVTTHANATTGAVARSDEDTIVLVVTPVNYAPRLPTPNVTHPLSHFSDVLVELEGTDVDDDPLTFVITTLPTHGTLYTTPDGVLRGERITAPRTSLAENVTRVLYSPILVDSTMAGEFRTHFGYTVKDPMQHALEPETLVFFEVTSGTLMPPLAGDQSTALLFSGFDEPAQLPLAAELVGTPLAGPRGLAVEMWMKSSAALARVGEAVLVECEAFSLQVGRVRGVSFIVHSANGTAAVVTATQNLPVPGSNDTDVNDGEWHFVAATFVTGVNGVAGATRLRVYVDGALHGDSGIVDVAGGALALAPAETTLSVGRYFAGLVDEIRIWDRALHLEPWAPSARYNWDATGHLALSGNEAGLLGYWRLNEHEEGILYDSAHRFASSAGRIASGMKVPSAAPFGDILKVAEDHSAVYCLQGNAPHLMLTLIPEHGTLFQTVDGKMADGPAIMAANANVSHPDGCLVFVPDTNFFGADALAYVAMTPEGESSAEVRVEIEVVPVNDVPEIVYFTRNVVTRRNEPATLRIAGADVDHPTTVAVTITALPYDGALYNGTTRITRTPMRLSPQVELTYVPIPNEHGGGAGDVNDADEFSFAITDPDGASSAMITVPCVVLRQQALVLDFPSPMALPDGLPQSLPRTFTLTAWIKAEPFPNAFRRRALTAYQVEGPNLANMYVDFNTVGTDYSTMGQAAYVMGTVMQAPPQDVQDGQWHHMAAIFDGGLKSVYVDGRLDTSQAVSAAAQAASGAAALGASSMVAEFLATYVAVSSNTTLTVGGASEALTTGPASASVRSALVDDVRVFGQPLSVKAMRAGMHARADELAADGLLSELNFDMGVGEEYLNLNAAVAGEAGYALSPSPGKVVVISDDLDGTTEGRSSPFTMDPTKALTVSVWFKSSRACSSMGALVAKGAVLGTWGAHRDSNVGGQWALQFTTSGGLGFHIMERRDLLISANSYKTYCDGAWHLATGIYDGANAVLYVDAAHQATTSMEGQFVTQRSLDLNANLVIGGDAEAARVSNDGVFATSVFHGQLDELKVWDYERSSNELVQDLSMRIATNTSDPGLRAWYRFNEPSALADVLPDDVVTTTQQGYGSPPRQGLVTGSGPSTVWTASQLPVQKSFDILGFNTPLKLRLFYVDKDGDRVEPVLTRFPERGTVWVSDETGALLKQIHRAGIVLTRDNTPDGSPVYADYIVYIPGDPMEDIPVPYAQLAYAASDGRELGPDELFTMNVFAVNEAPIANPATVIVLEDTPTAFTLNVYDPEGQDVSALVMTPPALGQLTNIAGQPITRALPDENGDIIMVYVPAPNDVSTQMFTYVAEDSEGTRSAEANVLLIIQCVNDAPLVELARDTQETYRGQRATLLLGITVSDVDSADQPDFSVTLSVPSGSLSDISATDAQNGGVQSLVLTGTLEDINMRLGRVYFYNSDDAVSIPVTITANDNHDECDNGPQSHSATLEISVIDSPFDNVAFTDDGRAIEMIYTCEVDVTPFEGTDDCSLILREDTLRTLGAFDQCYATGSLNVNPRSKIPCPRCHFGADRRTYTITLAPGASIVPGSELNSKGSVVTSTAAPPGLGCPLGNLLEGNLHPPYTLPVNPPLNPAIPTVAIDGPHRVGRCNPVRAYGLEVTNALGRALVYTWSVTGPEPLSSDVRSLVSSSRGPVLTLPPDLPFGTWTISVRVTNWLRATSQEPATLVVEKVDRPIPTIYIEGPDTIITRRNLRTTIIASVEATLCAGFCNDASSLSYSWEQTSQPFGRDVVVPDRVSSTGVVLSIPRNTLSATFRSNQFYDFEVRAEDCIDPTVIGDAVASVDVRPQPLVAAIAGGDRNWYNSRELVLDGSYSTDPDAEVLPAPGLPPAHLLFSWAAFDTAGVELTGLELGEGTTARLPSDTFTSAQDVTFVLTLTSGNVGDGDTRVSITSVTISFITNLLPEAFIDPILVWKLNPSTYNFFSGGGVPLLDGELTLEWGIEPLADSPGCVRVPECEFASETPDVTDPAVAPGGPNGDSLFLLPNTLNPGRIRITLTVCELRDSGSPLCSSASTTAVINSPPADGLVSVHPAGETSCEGSSFIVLAHSFFDVDIPVTYDFGFFDDDGMFFSLTARTRTTGGIIVLPAIAAEVGVRAMDGLEAVTLQAAPGEIISAADCGAPAPAEDSLADTVAALDTFLDIAIGTQNDDLSLQLLVNKAGFLAGDPPGTPTDAAGLQERQQLREDMAGQVADILAGGYYDEVKVLQALAVTAAVPAESTPAIGSVMTDSINAIIASYVSQQSGLPLPVGSMSVHVLSLLLEAAAADGTVTRAESENVFSLGNDLGRATLAYSDIPTRVPLELPYGEPPATPPGADSLRLLVNSAQEADTARDLEVGSFLLRRDTVAGLVTATASSSRALLADLSAESPMNRVVLVSLDFNGNIPPPINVYDYIADEDGEPITPIVGLRAFNVPDCPSSVAKYDSAGSGQRSHCELWMSVQPESAMSVTLFQDPLPDSGETIKLSLVEHDPGSYDPAVLEPGCKAVLLTDLEWNSDTVSTENSDAGIVCSTRAFGDFAAFAVPRVFEPPATPPSPVETQGGRPPEPPAPTPAPPPADSDVSIGLILGVVIAVVAVIVLLIALLIYRRRKNQNRVQSTTPNEATPEPNFGGGVAPAGADSETQPMIRSDGMQPSDGPRSNPALNE